MHESIQGFKIVGISVETFNANGQASKDIGQLWERFFKENVSGKITNKTSDDLYSVYTNYESDHHGKYTTLLGFPVGSLENIPEGLTGMSFNSGRFVKHVAKGAMPQAVVDKWNEIWQNKTLNRAYTFDFELYDDRAQLGDHSEVDIFIAIK